MELEKRNRRIFQISIVIFVRTCTLHYRHQFLLFLSRSPSIFSENSQQLRSDRLELSDTPSPIFDVSLYTRAQSREKCSSSRKSQSPFETTSSYPPCYVSSQMTFQDRLIVTERNKRSSRNKIARENEARESREILAKTISTSFLVSASIKH